MAAAFRTSVPLVAFVTLYLGCGLRRSRKLAIGAYIHLNTVKKKCTSQHWTEDLHRAEEGSHGILLEVSQWDVSDRHAGMQMHSFMYLKGRVEES